MATTLLLTVVMAVRNLSWVLLLRGMIIGVENCIENDMTCLGLLSYLISS